MYTKIVDLEKLYQEGFWVGPKETEATFLRRVTEMKALGSDPTPLFDALSLPKEKVFLISPTLICFRSAKGLPFWFGAVTHIYEWKGLEIPILELPEKKWFWINENEVTLHEAFHAKRAAFHEPKFEEILAYRTSTSFFRRILGPFFQKEWESYFFLLSTILMALSPLFDTFGYWLSFPFLFFLFFGTFRLFFSHYVVHQAWKNIKKTSANPERVLQMLTDAEIIEYARGRGAFIDRTSLRWRQISIDK